MQHAFPISQITRAERDDAAFAFASYHSEAQSHEIFFSKRNNENNPDNDKLSALVCNRFASTWRSLEVMFNDHSKPIFVFGPTQVAGPTRFPEILASARHLSMRLSDSVKEESVLCEDNIGQMNSFCKCQFWYVKTGSQYRLITDLMTGNPPAAAFGCNTAFLVVEGESVTLPFPDKQCIFEATQDGPSILIEPVDKFNSSLESFHPVRHEIPVNQLSTGTNTAGKTTASFYIKCNTTEDGYIHSASDTSVSGPAMVTVLPTLPN